jgi:hypothetical protein
METNNLDELYEYIIQDDKKKAAKRRNKIKDDFLSPDESNTVKFDSSEDENAATNDEEGDVIVERFKLVLASQTEKKVGNVYKIRPCISKDWLSNIANLNNVKI